MICRTALIGLLYMLTSQALACMCRDDIDSAAADLIVVGVVEDYTEQVGNDGYPAEMHRFRRYQVKVEKAFKGPQSPILWIDSSESDCGFWFERGKRYQIYALKSSYPGSVWVTSACSATSPEPSGR